jgi:hypothetical protein
MNSNIKKISLFVPGEQKIIIIYTLYRSILINGYMLCKGKKSSYVTFIVFSALPASVAGPHHIINLYKLKL